ncbi:MAG: hypothetical protein ACE5LC_07745 [Candidatus Aminicenantales bacterium]
MKVITTFSRGFKTTAKLSRMVIFLLVINLFLSLLLAVPVFKSITDSIGRSETGQRLAEGFDYLWWEEFRDETQGLASTFSPSIIGKGALLDNLDNLVGMKFLNLPPTLLAGVLFYIILHTFLAAGILSLVNEKSSFSMRRFFEGAGNYFFRFFLLTTISWVFFFALISLHRFFYSLRERISGTAFSEITPFVFWIAASTVIFFLLLFIHMLFDYARIHAVVEESRNILRSIQKGFSFVFRNAGRTLGLYYMLFALSLAVSIVYVLVKEVISQSALPGLLLAFIAQQLFIFALIWVRCWLYSSELYLFRLDS